MFSWMDIAIIKAQLPLTCLIQDSNQLPNGNRENVLGYSTRYAAMKVLSLGIRE